MIKPALRMIKKILIPYFPKGIKYCTPSLAIGAIYLFLAGHPNWAVVCLFIGLIVLTTNYVTKINLQLKKYDDYLSFLWMPFNNESRKYISIDRIIITKGNNSQMLNSQSRSRWTGRTIPEHCSSTTAHLIC